MLISSVNLHQLFSAKQTSKKIILQLIEYTKDNKYECYPKKFNTELHSPEHWPAFGRRSIEAFRKKKDANKFQALYYGKIILNAEVYISPN